MTSNSEYLYTIEEFISWPNEQIRKTNPIKIKEYLLKVKSNLENLKYNNNLDQKYEKNYNIYYDNLLRYINEILNIIDETISKRYQYLSSTLDQQLTLIRNTIENFMKFTDDDNINQKIQEIEKNKNNLEKDYNNLENNLENQINQLIEEIQTFNNKFNFVNLKQDIDKLNKAYDGIKNKNLNDSNILSKTNDIQMQVGKYKQQTATLMNTLKPKSDELKEKSQLLNTIKKNIQQILPTLYSTIYPSLDKVQFTYKYKDDYNRLNKASQQLESNIKSLTQKFEDLQKKNTLIIVNILNSKKLRELNELITILSSIENDINYRIEQYKQLPWYSKLPSKLIIKKSGSNENINIIISLLMGVLLILVFIIEKFANSYTLTNIIVYLSLITGISLLSYNIYLIIKNKKLNNK